MTTRILGLDPGSRRTGFGIIDVERGRGLYVVCGTVRAPEAEFLPRLKTIFAGVAEVVRTYKPNEVAIEQVFIHRNAAAALKLGQARGAALCAAMNAGLAVAEYTPTQIKQAVVGQGHATKEQVQYLVRLILDLPGPPAADAADALAVALCHCHTYCGIGTIRHQNGH